MSAAAPLLTPASPSSLLRCLRQAAPANDPPADHSAHAGTQHNAPHGPRRIAGLAGRSLAELLAMHAPGLPTERGVILEHLDPQAGTWQFSLDDGVRWQTIRTDILGRRGPMGLALQGQARLRVQPFVGSAHLQARLVLHAAQRQVCLDNGCYCAYDAEDRAPAARSFTLLLGLSAINATPSASPAQRPRNKRALAALRLQG
ncbi:hypothetical protein MASR1M59_03110 [Melaminivora sp.]